jgi:hypothetical protein
MRQNTPSGGTHYREVFLLAVASPMIAELLTSSAPPLEFFVWWIFILFVAFYGCGAILIREVSIRRGSGWPSILLFGGAYAILEEGMSTRVFFDPAARPLGPLAEHGLRWLGVNWIWTFDGIFYHAVFSVALPILLVYQVFQNSRDVPWLGRRGLTVVTVLFGLAAWVFLAKGGQYVVPKSYLGACLAAIAVLCVLAVRRRPRPSGSRPESTVSPIRFAILGFAATGAQVLQIYVLPLFVPSPWMTLAFFAGLVFAAGKLLVAWSGEGNWSRMQQCGLLVGALGFFALLAFFHEVNPTRTYDATGMRIVGLAALAALAWMWWKAAREVRQLSLNR